MNTKQENITMLGIVAIVVILAIFGSVMAIHSNRGQAVPNMCWREDGTAIETTCGAGDDGTCYVCECSERNTWNGKNDDCSNKCRVCYTDFGPRDVTPLF